MADFEDANSPTWRNQVEGHVNLTRRDRAARSRYDGSDGRDYELDDEPATLLVRPRGWHLPEKHMLVDGEPSSGALVRLRPVLLPQRPAAARARQRPVLLPAEDGAPPRGAAVERRLHASPRTSSASRAGTIRATVLIETLPAAFEMDEILYELREHSAGLNAGPLGLHLLDRSRCFRDDPRFVLPDRSDVTMTVPFMRAYTELLVEDLPRARRLRDGRHGRADPLAQGRGGQRAGARRRARRQGARGEAGLRRHLGRAPGRRRDRAARRSTRCSATRPTRSSAQRDDVDVTAAAAARRWPRRPGEITEAGLRTNVSVGFQYISFWLGGRGAAGINNLMEDAATAEISRSQIWQWVRHGTQLDDGRTVTASSCARCSTRRSRRSATDVGDETGSRAARTRPRAIFEQVALSPTSFPEFLTLPAYEYLD